MLDSGAESDSWRGESGGGGTHSPIRSRRQPWARDFPHLTRAPRSPSPIFLPRRRGLGAREVETCSGATAGDLRAAVGCPDLPDPAPVITGVLVTTCWDLAQR